MNNKVMAIDASSKCSGVAYYNENNELQTELIKASNKQTEKRIIRMRDRITEILAENPHINTVYLEDTVGKQLNTRTSRVLNWLQGAIVIGIYEFNPDIAVDFIGPSSWRSKIGIQGRAIKRKEQKKRDIAYINEKYKMNIESDDLADALGILTAMTQPSFLQ